MGGGLVDAPPLQEGTGSVCLCVCLGINLEGRGERVGSGTEGWEHCGVTAGWGGPPTLLGVAPGRSLTAIGNYIPGTVLEAEGEVRVKGRLQRKRVEGLNGCSSVEESRRLEH